MDVEVEHRLARVFIVVEREPVAGLGDALVVGDFISREEQAAEEQRVRLGRVVERRDSVLRYDEKRDGRRWAQSGEGDDVLVLVDDFLIRLAGDHDFEGRGLGELFSFFLV